MISELLRFGPFELNPRTGELTKRGRRLPLSPQPARLLALLASRPGDLVTRDEIRQHLWPDDVVVDFDLGLNSCLAHLRALLGDGARHQRCKLFPSSVQALYALGITESSLGRPADAIAALEKATAIARDPLSLGYLGYAYGVAGHTDKARRLLAEVTDASRRTFVSHKPFIVLHVGLREVDRALDYLEAAGRVRDPILFHVTRVPIFETFFEEPRFRAVMDRVPTLGQRGASRDQPIGQRPASRRSGIPESRKAARRSARSTAPS